MPDRCKDCKQPVRIAVVADTGQTILLDQDPTDTGTIRLAAGRRGGLPRAVHIGEHQRERLAGELYQPHTCPEPESG